MGNVCYASVMKQFLFPIQPKSLLGALLILLTNAVPINSNVLHRNLVSSSEENPAPILIGDPLLPSDSPSPTSPTNDPTNNLTDDSPDDPDESPTFSSQLIFSAINPGYTSPDKLSNVGELIELQNLADAPISLAGFSIRYTNSSGRQTTLHTFAKGDLMTGEFLLMRYAHSPDFAQSDLTYTPSLALTAGPLELIYDNAVVDTVCWTGKTGCEKPFKSSSPTTLARNLKTGEFEHLVEYIPHFDSSAPGFLPAEPEDPEFEPPETPAAPKCRALEFSEIFSYYADAPAEQFIEFYNSSPDPIELNGCQVKYKNKSYALTGTVAAGSYLAYYPSPHFALTKNPSTNNSLSLIDADGEVVDELAYPHGQKKGASYAKLYDSSGASHWSITYTPSPNLPNLLQDFRSCPAGKVINPLTGNCVNVTSSTSSECPAGKYRNPLTGRCKNIASSSSGPKACAEGYERNPTTNRCRKIAKPNNGADYALVPTTSSSNKTTFVALGAVILIVLLGVIYITLQFRHEAIRAIRKISQRCHHVLKNHLPRKIRRDRDKET